MYDNSMSLAKLSIWARKIHRLFVLVTSILGIGMSFSGISMWQGNAVMIGSLSIRHIHNVSSIYFAISLLIMIITGLIMYTYPWIVKISRKPNP